MFLAVWSQHPHTFSPGNAIFPSCFYNEFYIYPEEKLVNFNISAGEKREVSDTVKNKAYATTTNVSHTHNSSDTAYTSPKEPFLDPSHSLYIYCHVCSVLRHIMSTFHCFSNCVRVYLPMNLKIKLHEIMDDLIFPQTRLRSLCLDTLRPLPSDIHS